MQGAKFVGILFLIFVMGIFTKLSRSVMWVLMVPIYLVGALLHFLVKGGNPITRFFKFMHSPFKD